MDPLNVAVQVARHNLVRTPELTTADHDPALKHHCVTSTRQLSVLNVHAGCII